MGKEIPSKEQINKLDFKKETFENGNQKLNKLALFPGGKRDNPTKRIRVIAENVGIKLSMEPPYTLLTWKEFDEYLAKYI